MPIIDCKKCEVFIDCPVVKINGGKPIDKCLGPIYMDPRNPGEALEEIERKIRTKDYKKIELEWEN